MRPILVVGYWLADTGRQTCTALYASQLKSAIAFSGPAPYFCYPVTCAQFDLSNIYFYFPPANRHCHKYFLETCACIQCLLPLLGSGLGLGLGLCST